MPESTRPAAPRGLAVVTGASSGIGEATALALLEAGYAVIAAARRISPDSPQTCPAVKAGCIPAHLDVTDPASIQALADLVDGTGLPLTLLVNNAGVSIHADTVADSDPAHWQQMYDVNVFGVLRVTQALLPPLVQHAGHMVVIGSTVGHVAYERGGAYASSKHAVSALAATLRLELNGTPVRITEVAPGMIQGTEFMNHRFPGDPAARAAVYRGVAAPLTPADIADCVVWCATRPPHVDVDLLMVRPVAQAAQHKVHRVEEPAS